MQSDPGSGRWLRRLATRRLTATLCAAALVLPSLIVPATSIAHSPPLSPDSTAALVGPGPAPDQAKPSKQECRTAIKLLTKYASLFPKVNKGKPMPAKVKEKLDRLRDAGTIKFDDLPSSLRPNFPAGPGGVLKRKTLEEIKELCK